MEKKPVKPIPTSKTNSKLHYELSYNFVQYMYQYYSFAQYMYQYVLLSYNFER